MRAPLSTPICDGKDNYYYLRCVHGGQLDFGNFADNHDGAITDTSTDLMWQQSELGVMTWSNALNYCENLELSSGSGQTDWRLPNIKEIESIVDDARFSPAIDPIFDSAIASYYWSSTTGASYPHYAWDVYFDYGDVGYYVKDYGDDVRCVRGGQSGSFVYDFNGDGKTDILWRNRATGENRIWVMDGANYVSTIALAPLADTNWDIAGTGDFNNDGKIDIVWRNKANGIIGAWIMNGTTPSYLQHTTNLCRGGLITID